MQSLKIQAKNSKATAGATSGPRGDQRRGRAPSSKSSSREKRARGKPFPKGLSGNPAGRPKGTRNRATLLAELLLDDEAETIVRKVMEKAKQGDMVALRLCLDRLVPPRRDRPVHFEFPALNSAEDAGRAMAAITTAVARGELTPAEAAELTHVLQAYVQVLEISEIERRVQALELRQPMG